MVKNLEAVAYDRADFDYSTETDLLPRGHAATHIGMFLAWAANRGLINEYHERHSAEALDRLRKRGITGREFFEAACKEQFAEKDLNVEGNAFAEHYYRNAAGEKGRYFADYRKALATGLPSFWHVADTWENFDKLAPIITERFEAWKNPVKKRWWQFWK